MPPTSAPRATNSTQTDAPANDLARVSAGLDALEVSAQPPVRSRGRVFKSLAPVLAFGAFLAVWQLVSAAGLVEEWILPSPALVWAALVEQAASGLLWESIGNSLRRGLQGFAVSILIATPIGVAIALNQTTRAFLKPLMSGLQQLPSVAWVPAAIIWFGLSDSTIYAVVLLGAVPSIVNGLVAGIDQIQPIYLRVGRVLGATGLVRITKIVIPAAWPGYLAGLEQGWAFAWRSLMAAELIAVSPTLGQGLGLMLDTGRQLGEMPLVLGGILVIMLVGVLVDRCLFNPLRQRTLSRRGLLQPARLGQQP